MSGFDPIFDQAGMQFGVDPALLKAQAMVESGFNPGAVNRETGATGLMQFMPETAKSLGIDPINPQQAIFGAAKLMRQNLDRYGSVEGAVSAYHGGTDQKNWGDKTQAYVSKVADAFDNIKRNGGIVTAPAQEQDSDPIMAALTNPQPAAPQPQQAQQPQPSMLDQARGYAGNFQDSLVHHLAKLPITAVQAGVNLLGSPEYAGQVNQKIAQNEADYQKNTPTNAATIAGATIGEVAPFVMTPAGRLLGAAGDAVGGVVKSGVEAIPYAQKLAGLLGSGVSGAVQGGIVGAAQPVITGQDQTYGGKLASNVEIGAALGGVLPIAGKALASTYENTIKPLVQPGAIVADWAKRVAGDKAQQIAAALKGAPELVPGSKPTTAQVWNNPDLALMEKGMVTDPATKNAWMARAGENNAARLDQLQTLAHSTENDPLAEAAIGALRGQRNANSLESLNWATLGEPEATKFSSIEDALASAPHVDPEPIIGRINATLDSSLGQNPVIRGALSDVKNAISGQISREGGIRPDILDGIRQNLNRTLAKNSPNGAVSTQEAAGLSPVSEQITSTIDGAVPGFRDYLSTYAKGSEPINDIQAAQKLLGAVTRGSPPDVFGKSQISPQQLVAALNSSDKARYGMSDEAYGTVQNILDDLRRSQTGAGAVRANGSDTITNSLLPQALAGALYGKQGAGGVLSKIPYAGKPIAEIATTGIQNKLAEALLNPEVMAAYLKVQPGPTKMAALAQRLPQLSPMLLSRNQALAAQLNQ